MKNYKNEKSLFVALLGCTICLMFTLMYFLHYGKSISFVCLMMLRIVDFLINS